MAFKAKGTKITMDAYDFGTQIPFDITDLEFETGDTILFELKKSKDSGTLISKEYTNATTQEGLFRFFLEFTKKESESLYPGNYVYYLKHIRDDEIRDTLVSGEDFVIKK